MFARLNRTKNLYNQYLQTMAVKKKNRTIFNLVVYR